MYRQKRTKISALAIVLSLTAFVTVSGVDKTPQEKDLEYLIGEWESDYELPGYGVMREEAKYWWGENKHEIKFEVKVYSSGALIDTSTGFIKIDQEKGTIYTETNSQAGQVYKSWETGRDGNTAFYDGEATGNPMMGKFKIKITTRTMDEMDFAIFLPKGEEFVEFLAVVYKRVKE